MQGTYFFVHGTSVREKDYRSTWKTIQERAQQNGITGIDFVGSEWGWNVGVPSDRLAASLDDVLPPKVRAKAVGGAPPTADELDVAVWALLLDDPLFKLRVASGLAAPAGAIVVGGAAADQETIDRLNGLGATMPNLDGTGLTAQELTRAAATVAATPELRGAAQAIGDASDPALIAAVARAVVATALAGHRHDSPGEAPAASMDGAVRDALVARIETALTPRGARSISLSGLKERLKQKAIEFAAPKVMAAAREHRLSLAGQGTGFFGDVFLYLRRGAAMADFVRKDMQNLKRPVVAVGHSLGGIILVDILSREDHPPVDLLVTVGSQSPVFYAMDALELLRPGQSTPAPFTPWLNLYSRDDFISFRASRIFGGQAGIRDEVIDAGVPFPESHSAYWRHDRVYKLIRDAWPR